MEYEWQEPTVERCGELAQSIEQMVQSLDDVIVDHLSVAVENGSDVRPKLDKDLQAARRALLKAAHILQR